MLIECPRCDAKVDGEILASQHYGGEEEEPTVVSFLKCPACRRCIVAERMVFQGASFDQPEYSSAVRLWPEPSPNTGFDFYIPTLTRQSLEEAQRCFGARAYAACSVMCRRAIEAICAEYKTKSKNLMGSLRELRDKKVIDERLFEWGDALRQQGNIGAHASEEDISREDARNVLEFARAICEYVFVLSAKYAEYQARQKAKIKPKIPSPPKPPPAA